MSQSLDPSKENQNPTSKSTEASLEEALLAQESMFDSLLKDLNKTSEEIRQIERFLSTRHVQIPYEHIMWSFRTSSPEDFRIALSWWQGKNGKFRLCYREYVFVNGTWSPQGEPWPLIELKVIVRLRAREFLPEFVTHFGEFVQKSTGLEKLKEFEK